jgi:hypothetical protein
MELNEEGEIVMFSFQITNVSLIMFCEQRLNTKSIIHLILLFLTSVFKIGHRSTVIGDLLQKQATCIKIQYRSSTKYLVEIAGGGGE